MGSQRISDEADLSLSSMEGIYVAPAVEPRPADGIKPVPVPSIRSGAALSLLVTAASYAIHYIPAVPFRIVSEHGIRRPISASIIAILAGVFVRNVFAVPASAGLGCKVIVRRLLPITIVLAGAGLNLTDIAIIGFNALTITVLCISVATASAFYIGRMMGLTSRSALLIGAGTAICGTSAIIAVAPLISAEDEDVTLSVGTVNLLGIVLMFLLPFLGGALHLSDTAFGVWAGTSIHAVPQAVAAGFAFSEPAGTLATLVKLVRVTLLAPFIVALIFLYVRRSNRQRVTVHFSRLIPAFVWGFAAMAILNTGRFFPALVFQLAPWLAVHTFTVPMSETLVDIGNYILTFVMAAMGLEVHIRQLAAVGGKALLVGSISTAILCLTSLMLIRVLL
ncbi:MAG: putative sulfate exporter family transporter [Bryobacteraceae bacterium]